MSRDKKKQQQTHKETSSGIDLWKVIIPGIVTILVAIIGYYQVRTSIYVPIWATQTAQAQIMTATQSANISQVQNIAMTQTALSEQLTEVAVMKPKDTNSILVTETPTPSATSLPKYNLAFEKPKLDELIFWPPILFEKYIDPAMPIIKSYNVYVKSGQAYTWKYLWCARHQAGLYENLANVSFEFRVDDVPLSNDLFLIYQSPPSDRPVSEDWECQRWVTVLKDLKQGETFTLSVLYTIAKPISSDGTFIRQSGEYRHDLVIYVN